MKPHLKSVVLIATGIAAWGVISAPWAMSTAPRTTCDTWDYVWAGLLALSVAFLQWGLRAFLMPLRNLPKERHRELRRVVRGAYGVGLHAWLVGGGYLALGLYLLLSLTRGFGVTEHRFGLLPAALLLVGLGTMSHTRAAVAYLCDVQARLEPELEETSAS